ncbi:MAG: hypothetical protein IPL83_07690 [Bdellovibrionales bacterium]|nr:hypothetical protein [Bdellovibrionales bacterium]
MDGVHSFFEKIGGQTKNIRIDNLSPCVKRVKKDGGRDYTDAFNRAIKYYDFGVLPCSPGRGNEKVMLSATFKPGRGDLGIT